MPTNAPYECAPTHAPTNASTNAPANAPTNALVNAPTNGTNAPTNAPTKPRTQGELTQHPTTIASRDPQLQRTNATKHRCARSHEQLRGTGARGSSVCAGQRVSSRSMDLPHANAQESWREVVKRLIKSHCLRRRASIELDNEIEVHRAPSSGVHPVRVKWYINGRNCAQRVL